MPPGTSTAPASRVVASSVTAASRRKRMLDGSWLGTEPSRNISPYRDTWIAHRCAIQLQFKTQVFTKKISKTNFWVMDFNSQHFRLEIANFKINSLFIALVLPQKFGNNSANQKIFRSIVLGLFDAFPCELKLLNRLDRKRITF